MHIGLENHADSLCRTFMEQSSDRAMFLVDWQGQILIWNAGAALLFGYSSDEIVGHHFSRLFAPDEIEHGEPQRQLRQGNLDKFSDASGWHAHKNGTRFFASGTVTPVRDGEFHGFVKTLRAAAADRPDEDQALRGWRQQMRDDFLSALSHELRTPLSAILLWTRILRGGNAQEREEAIDTIERSANSEIEIIDDLMCFSRSVLGKLRLNLRSADIGAVVQASVDAARPAAQAKGIELVTLWEAGSRPVYIDPVRTHKILSKLLSNAIKFTPHGGRIQVVQQWTADRVRIQVIDTGKGIAPEVLPRLFDRFGQSDLSNGRIQHGLGIGLTIARELVELHGGIIRATSPGENQGATFTVEFPFDPADRSAADRQVPATGKAAGRFMPSKRLSGLRIIVVDDEPDTRNVIRWLMEQSGAEVTAFGSAAEVLASLPDSNSNDYPQILLSDIGMADQDGYELIRTIRATELRQGHGQVQPRRLHAAAITAYARDEDRCRALSAGFEAFLTKPVEPEELVRVVQSLSAIP
jgi:PAS domain S-box-containing protein